MGKIGKIARRTFLIGSVAVAGGVAFGYYKYKKPYPNPLKRGLQDGEAALTPYVLVKEDGVTIITPRGEMGQGVQSTLAALVAEELDIDWADVKIDHGPASKAYYNEAVLEEGLPISPLDESKRARRYRSVVPIVAKFMALQGTGGSSAMADGYEKMRVAGATAREALKRAAAKKWGVEAEDCRTQSGVVIGPDGRRAAYGELAAEAANVKLPKTVELKPKSEWKILGRSVPRLDQAGKVTGTAKFAADIRLPGMKFATIKTNPFLGGEMISYDASAAEGVKGFDRIIEIDGGVAVIADNSWSAMQAADLIEFKWGSAPYPAELSGHFDAVAKAFDNKKFDSRFRDDGDVEDALKSGEVLSGEYRAPYVAHATMEPLNAAAQLKDGRFDIWVGHQTPTDVLAVAKDITGLPEKDIYIHTQIMGGGFGRKSEPDFPAFAAQIAVAMEGTPVLMTWSREEDMTHDVYRPLAMGRFRASIEDGKAAALDFSVSSPSVLASGAARGGPNIPGSDLTIAQTIWDQPYDIPNYRATAYRAPELLPIGAWRSVGASQNAFFQESIIDELAHAAGRDPMDFRLDMINHDRCKSVLATVKDMSGWTRQLPEGHARGVAFCMSFGVPTAEVVEIAQTDQGIKIVRVFAAADVGTALDPRNVEAQIMSGVIFGLSAAMMSEITVEGGQVAQTNFHDFELMRMYQAPDIQIKVLELGDRVRGIGEPGTPPAAPALANAIFALTGQRLREMPFNKFVDFA